MTSVNGVGSNTPIQKLVSQPVRKNVPAAAPSHARPRDRVELSGVGHLLKALKTNDVRADKVAQIKGEIESGKYDADGKKLDGAIDKLLDELGK